MTARSETSEGMDPGPLAPGPAAGKPAPFRVKLLAWRDAFRRATTDNPVIAKEFRTRMRGTRAYWILLGYTLLLALWVAILYFSFDTAAHSEMAQVPGGAGFRGAQELGRSIYYAVFLIQASMIAMITPAITSGTITIEREQRSYDLLVTTSLRNVDLVRGKLAAAIAFVILLLTASLPLVSLTFLVGGVSPGEIFFCYLLQILSAAVYSAIGIFWSSTLRSTATATVISYLTVLFLAGITAIPGFLASAPGSMSANSADIPFQSLNPFWATLRAVQPEYFFWRQSPSWISAALLNLLFASLTAVAAMGRLEHFEAPHPRWIRGLATAFWCALALFLFGPILGGMAHAWTTSSAVDDSTAGALTAMLALICLIVPIFTTGDLIVRRGESALKRYLSGFLPHRAFAADLSCGMPLVLGWAGFLLALIPFAMVTEGKAALFHPAAVWVPGLLLTVAVIAGLAGVGNLLSVLLPSRWAACVLTYLAGIVLMLLPYFALFGWYQANQPRSTGMLWQLLYLIPFEGLYQLMSPGSYLTDRPALLFSPAVPVWLVTTVIYVGIAVICFGLTAVQVRRAGERLLRSDAAV